MTQLSIILVNWNCIDYTEQCVASIQATADDLRHEIIVVDNASADSPCQSLVDRFPGVRLVLSQENIGFGRANNLGASESVGDYLLFLNPDTLIDSNALRQMLDALSASPEAGAIGCRLLNADGSLQSSSVQSFPTIANQLLGISWLERRWPDSPLWGKQALYARGTQPVHEVDVVSGACLMMKRQVFELVGGFNPKIFLYAEEVDLCSAIRKAGWKVLHTSSAEIIHFGGQSTKNCEEGYAAVTMRDSVYRFLARSRGNRYALVYRAGLVVSAMCRLAALAPALAVSAVLKKRTLQQKSARAIRKWFQIAKWGLGIKALQYFSSAPKAYRLETEDL